MALEILGRRVDRVSVIGSGQIGPDIALHFSKVLAPHGADVIVVDVASEALDRGAAKVQKKVAKGVETGAFKEAQGESIVKQISFTTDYDAVKGSSLVVEAATENLDIKKKIFATIEGLVGPDTLLTSNSSHLEPERIFAECDRKDRGLITHYFFPAERNPALEIVPASFTNPDHTRWAMKFFEAIGKVPVSVGSRYGFAVDPIFEGLFLAALLLVDAGVGTVAQVDEVSRRVLGQGVGPFTAMNLAGGNPITHAGLPQYQERVHRWFHSPPSLAKAVETGEAWPTAGRGETVDVDEQTATKIGDAMLGAYFGLATEVVNAGLISADDLEVIVELALVMTPPFKLINQVGVEKALSLVEAYHAHHPDFPVPEVLAEQASRGPFRIRHVRREDHDGIAVLTLMRPRVLNALSGEVFAQIEEHMEDLATDGTIRGAVITGFGVKAFAAGADIQELATLTTAEEAATVARRDQGRVGRVASLGKPVVAALNGLALGGGSELAQACTARIALKGLKVCFGQPEVNLGIIPGCGGTQRLPRIIGLEAAWRILRDGKPISGERALELGFLHALAEGDLVEEAIALARGIADGSVEVRTLDPAPVDVPASLPEVDIGHLSTQVDDHVQRAIREGLALPLDEGLAVEARLFGEVFETEDARIGLDHFVNQGPKKPAPFRHRAS